MNNKKVICFVIPTLQMGGMERVASLLSNYGIKQEYSIHIICLINMTSYYHVDSNVSIIAPSFEYKKGLLNKIRVFYFLFSCLKKIKPNTVLSFSEIFNPLSIITAKLVKVPVYISDRSSPEKKLGLFTQILRQLTYPFANGMVSQTELAKSISLAKRYNNNIAVIPNPLKKIDSNVNLIKENIVISVGRLIPSKNFKELIDIFFESDTEKTWQLWILGDGSEKKSLQEKISGLMMDDRVKLLGAVKDIDTYLSKASIFAFTSISEGFPNALSEAIAYPLPCIAYDCPAGPADLIDNGVNGFLIPIHDKNSFKIALKKLMINSSLREGLVRNYEAHRNKYDVDAISAKYFSFLLDGR